MTHLVLLSIDLLTLLLLVTKACNMWMCIHHWTTRNNTGKVHTRNTQQKFKNRMQQHFNEVQKLVKLGKKLDCCAKHFATQLCDTSPSPANQGMGTTCSIISQGNLISVVKTVGRRVHPQQWCPWSFHYKIHYKQQQQQQQQHYHNFYVTDLFTNK